MDDFLTAFGALCVVISVYAILIHHIKGIGNGATPAYEPPSWIDDDASIPAYAVSASWNAFPREPRRHSRQRLMRHAPRSTASSHSSRR